MNSVLCVEMRAIFHLLPILVREATLGVLPECSVADESKTKNVRFLLVLVESFARVQAFSRNCKRQEIFAKPLTFHIKGILRQSTDLLTKSRICTSPCTRRRDTAKTTFCVCNKTSSNAHLGHCIFQACKSLRMIAKTL